MINNISSIDNKNNQIPMDSLHKNQTQNTMKDTLTKNTLIKSDDIQKQEASQMVKKIQNEILKSQEIAIKIIKGQPITKNEDIFISEKYPDLKQVAEDSIEEIIILKDVLKSCKTEGEIQQVLAKSIKSIKNMVEKGLLTEAQSKIKLAAIEECKTYIKNYTKELEKVQNLAVRIIKGDKLTQGEQKLINDKHSYIKEMINECFQENFEIREKIKLCKSNNEIEKLLSNEINNIKNKGEKGILSKLEVKIKLASIMELENTLSKENIQLKRAIIISNKIIKGIKLSNNEDKFINETYPEIKEFSEKLQKEYDLLKKELKLCSTDYQKEELIHEKIKNIKNLEDKNILLGIQEKIRKEAIDIIKGLKKNKYKEENLIFFLNPYLYSLFNGIPFKIGTPLMAIIIIISSILIFS